MRDDGHWGPFWTPLHIAAQNGDAVTVQQLLETGVYVNAQTDLGETPLHTGQSHVQSVVGKALAASAIRADKKHPLKPARFRSFFTGIFRRNRKSFTGMRFNMRLPCLCIEQHLKAKRAL
ncbi:MAG: hypothetical protein JSS27_02255 [Planctomycetes bacterium]|nr:hypothetical protein [Planctomycetota bacterium]